MQRATTSEAHLFVASLVWTQVPATSYLVIPAEMIGFVRFSTSRAASRQSCCVPNSNVVTVPDAAAGCCKCKNHQCRQLGDVRRYTSGLHFGIALVGGPARSTTGQRNETWQPLDSLILPLSLHGKCLASASGEKSRRKNKQLHYPVTLT